MIPPPINNISLSIEIKKHKNNFFFLEELIIITVIQLNEKKLYSTERSANFI
jgi:hypothetical protein